MADDPQPPPTISWLRAFLTVAGIAIVGIGVLVYGTNAFLTKTHRLTRHTLVGIATPVFFLLLIAMAVALRWLQRRKFI